MLTPDDRSLLVDLLSAPDGYRLDTAVATTFTLDLTALLAVPLAFAGADLSSGADPLTALQAVRQHSNRIDVFCQGGNIVVPKKANDLLSFLEPMVHQVGRPQPGRLFHPKLWVLRFVHVDDPADLAFRMICGSRNLTHDCAWDAAVVLDGASDGRQRRAVNNPLADFVASLSNRAPGLTPERAERVAGLAESLRTVEWEAPPDVFIDDEWLHFHSFGRSRSRHPDLTSNRSLVVSPFINDEGIAQFEGDVRVISRGEELDRLDAKTRAWFEDRDAELFVLDDDAAIPPIDDEAAGRKWSLSGLHAKLYVLERAQRAHVFIGSANATDAAWSGNDEFLVELVGKKAVYGIDSMITAKSSFGSIISPYTLGEALPIDPAEELRRQLENALHDLAAVPLVATLSGSDAEGWVEALRSESNPTWNIPGSVLTAGLLTLPAEARPTMVGEPLDSQWLLHALEDATPFVTLELRVGAVAASTAVLARLVGDPSDRLDRVLARQFRDEATFLRFLLMLLSLASGTGSLADLPLDFGSAEGAAWITQSSGLLESLMNALATSPSSIDDVARLVERLSATAEGRSVLPIGWESLWNAVLEARARIGAH